MTAFASACCGCGNDGAGADGTIGAASCAAEGASDAAVWAVTLVVAPAFATGAEGAGDGCCASASGARRSGASARASAPANAVTNASPAAAPDVPAPADGGATGAAGWETVMP